MTWWQGDQPPGLTTGARLVGSPPHPSSLPDRKEEVLLLSPREVAPDPGRRVGSPGPTSGGGDALDCAGAGWEGAALRVMGPIQGSKRPGATGTHAGPSLPGAWVCSTRSRKLLLSLHSLLVWVAWPVHNWRPTKQASELEHLPLGLIVCFDFPQRLKCPFTFPL